MTRLTPEEKAERARDRMLEKTREMGAGTYSSKVVAPIFQRMIRAEAAALPAGRTHAIANGKLYRVDRLVGECVCVTCGKVGPWSSGIGGMHTGHFLPRTAPVLYEEGNVAPQCSYCNRYQGGAPQQYRLWMAAVRGEETIERLERLKATIRSFTRDELVDMKIAFTARLKAAEDQMSQNPR